MSSSPGTVSKILWHFTGGPNWNEAEKRQEKEPKSPEVAYDSLCKIVDSKKLRVGGYRESFRAKERVFGPTIIRGDRIKDIELTFLNEHRIVESSRVCCVADIPIMHLHYHATRYGKIAIGFHRNALVAAGFCPVFYQRFDSHLPSNLYTLWDNLGKAYHVKLYEILEQYAKPREDKSEIYDEDGRSDFDRTIAEGRFIDFLLEKAVESLMHMLAHVKTFNEDEFDVIYTEREWRSISDHDYQHDEIAMIVLPREGGYFLRFIAEAERLGIPRSIPIVPWEDLVEH